MPVHIPFTAALTRPCEDAPDEWLVSITDSRDAAAETVTALDPSQQPLLALHKKLVELNASPVDLVRVETPQFIRELSKTGRKTKRKTPLFPGCTVHVQTLRRGRVNPSRGGLPAVVFNVLLASPTPSAVFHGRPRQWLPEAEHRELQERRYWSPRSMLLTPRSQQTRDPEQS